MSNIVIFTDGSCIKKNYIPISCGYGIHFPNGELKDISKSFTKLPLTNQRAELYAIYKAIQVIKKKLEFNTINIYTDSEYSIKCLTIWINNWKNNGWKTSNGKEVANKDIIIKIDKYLKKYKVNFFHVKAHTNKLDFYSLGNRKADELALLGANLGF